MFVNDICYVYMIIVICELNVSVLQLYLVIQNIAIFIESLGKTVDYIIIYNNHTPPYLKFKILSFAEFKCRNVNIIWEYYLIYAILLIYGLES